MKIQFNQAEKATKLMDWLSEQGHPMIDNVTDIYIGKKWKLKTVGFEYPYSVFEFETEDRILELFAILSLDLKMESGE